MNRTMYGAPQLCALLLLAHAAACGQGGGRAGQTGDDGGPSGPRVDGGPGDESDSGTIEPQVDGGHVGMTSAPPGRPGTDSVSAGEVSWSPSYKLVFTLGQPTQNQLTTTSPSYRMQGGLIGAEGSLP